MVASHTVATGELLEHDARLEEQAALRHRDGHFLHLARPEEKARVTTAAMNRDEVQVVMEACESCADLVVLFQIRSGRSQQVRTTLHLAGEGVLGQAHADGGHLGGEEGGLDHLVAPLVHILLPVGELFRVSLRNLVLNLVGSLTDLPEEAPLGVGDRD